MIDKSGKIGQSNDWKPLRIDQREAKVTALNRIVLGRGAFSVDHWNFDQDERRKN